jgi:hypothetical protein
MNSNKIKLACAIMFTFAAVGAHAQTTSDSNSGSSSDSSAQSGTSTISGSGNSQNTSTSSLRNSGNSSASAGVRSSGNSSSSVSVSVNLPSTTGSGTTGTASAAQQVANAATGPGTSPYNTQSQENVSYSGSQTIKTNPAIQAPGLTTTLSDTCMGSVSFGFSAPGFGATAGSTLVDQACVRRLDAREFRAMGLTDVALALLCESDANRRAVEATGHLCPGTTHPLAKAEGNVNPTATVQEDQKYNDPIVRDRLGLPKLVNTPPAPVQAPVAQPAPVVQQQAQTPVVQQPAQPVQTATADIAHPDPQPIPQAENPGVEAEPVNMQQPTTAVILH